MPSKILPQAGLAIILLFATGLHAGEPADPAPLEAKVKAADFIFTAVATHMTWIRDGKPLNFTPKLGDLDDPVRIDLDISEVFPPDGWKGKRHATILLYHTPRGASSYITGLAGKKMIYLLQKSGDGYEPAADQCEPAVPLDLREKVAEEAAKKSALRPAK
ncbi:MAG TPA: hypothetical protein VG733_03915 [Chthoniobacteraceae bacterium]|nr:hypothetical protein [Chthoniobacteraceae bacterium]